VSPHRRGGYGGQTACLRWPVAHCPEDLGGEDGPLPPTPTLANQRPTILSVTPSPFFQP